MRLSSSEIKRFLACKRSWYYNQVLGYRHKKSEHTGPLFLGDRVHKALEVYYENFTIEAALGFLHGSYVADVELYPNESDALLKEKKLTTAMIEGYFQWLEETGEDEYLEVLGVEGMLETPYGNHTLIGKYDLMVLDTQTGLIWLLDHKTAQDFSASARFQQEIQFKHYAAIGTANFGDRFGGVIWNGLRKVQRTGRAKPPFYMRERITFNRDELRSYWESLYFIVDDMERAIQDAEHGRNNAGLRAVYPNPTRENCGICTFKNVCTMFDDGSDLDFVLQTEYETVNPLERYDDVETVTPDQVLSELNADVEGTNTCKT
jgi:RecB family exonuclease